ncbi:enoyl-CoA hydratase/isomerase family protein [Desulfococcaceae bacterium HSG8]|nr:enoyl-CoA hydratase/isomerase family protein [Desulfococcaceae bacterium HSG8]
MAMVEYTLDENIAIITMNNGENRFNPDFLAAFLDVLDEVEKKTDARTLVVTSSDKKIFSNGIDLDWLVPVIKKEDITAAKDFFYLMNELFRKTLMCPMLTVAAISGHAFAGGAIWSCAFDFRLMRSDRGFFCFPEVDLGIPFLPGMLALLKKAIPMYKMEEMTYTGSRLTAQECEKHHIITKACHIDDLMNEALGFAKQMNKKREIVNEFKARLYRDILHAIDVEDKPYIESGKFNIS